MKKLLFIIPLVFLCGCATLKEMGKDLSEIHKTGEAKPYISASSVILNDIVKNPYDELGALGLGYALALIRRWYKRKMGSKG